MRGTIVLLIGAMALLAGCGTASKPRWSPFLPPRSEAWHSCRSVLLRYDADGDGTVTRAELEAGLKQFFWQVDANRDGRLDPDEVAVANQRRILLDGSAAIPLVDWNRDGYVDFGEFAGGIRSVFDELDQDSDGRVTPAEFAHATC